MTIDGSTFVLSKCLSVYSLYAGNWCFLDCTSALCACHFCSYSAIVLGLISSNTAVLLSGTVDPNHVVVSEKCNYSRRLVISKSKGPSETLRDIRASTYQMYSIEENTNGTTKFHK